MSKELNAKELLERVFGEAKEITDPQKEGAVLAIEILKGNMNFIDLDKIFKSEYLTNIFVKDELNATINTIVDDLDSELFGKLKKQYRKSIGYELDEMERSDLTEDLDERFRDLLDTALDEEFCGFEFEEELASFLNIITEIVNNYELTEEELEAFFLQELYMKVEEIMTLNIDEFEDYNKDKEIVALAKLYEVIREHIEFLKD